MITIKDSPNALTPRMDEFSSVEFGRSRAMITLKNKAGKQPIKFWLVVQNMFDVHLTSSD